MESVPAIITKTQIMKERMSGYALNFDPTSGHQIIASKLISTFANGESTKNVAVLSRNSTFEWESSTPCRAGMYLCIV